MSADGHAAAGLLVHTDGPVATFTLNRPEVRNAQHPALWAAIVAALEELSDDVRVLVLRGAGGNFSAGLDLGLLDPTRAGAEGSLVALAQRSDQEIIDQIDMYQQAFVRLSDPRFISIAVVEGFAIGAGFQMALSCDLRIVADDAKFCMKEPALGLVPDLAGTKPLVDAVGYSRALEICASARWVTGAEAAQIGLAQTAVGAAELEATLTATVSALTAHPIAAVRATQQLLRSAATNSLEEQRLAERTAQVARFRELSRLLGT